MILSKDKRHKGCGFDLWVGKIPLEKGDNLFHVLVWKIAMDRGDWRATVLGVAELDTTEHMDRDSWSHRLSRTETQHFRS